MLDNEILEDDNQPVGIASVILCCISNNKSSPQANGDTEEKVPAVICTSINKMEPTKYSREKGSRLLVGSIPVLDSLLGSEIEESEF